MSNFFGDLLSDVLSPFSHRSAPKPKPQQGDGTPAGGGSIAQDQLSLSARVQALRDKLGQGADTALDATQDAGMAQAALDAMQADGRLFDKDMTGDGKTTLDALEQIASEPLGAGVKRQEVLDSAVEEAEDPSKIQQNNRGTCGATSFEYYLDEHHPAEFVRLLAGLVSQAGQVQTQAGTTMSADPTSLAPDDSGRLAADRILQSAFMKYARGIFQYRDSMDDGQWYTKVTTGLSDGEVIKLFKDLASTPMHADGHFWNEWIQGTANGAAVLGDVAKATAKGAEVPVSVHFDGPKSKHSLIPGGHFLLVTQVTADTVTFRNPWGVEGSAGDVLGTDGQTPLRTVTADGLDSMSRKDFEGILMRAMLPGN